MKFVLKYVLHRIKLLPGCVYGSVVRTRTHGFPSLGLQLHLYFSMVCGPFAGHGTREPARHDTGYEAMAVGFIWKRFVPLSALTRARPVTTVFNPLATLFRMVHI